MNPLKIYIKNRLEKLEQESEELKKWYLKRSVQDKHMYKCSNCFTNMVKDLDLRIKYDDETKCYLIYSYKKDQVIYRIDSHNIDYATEELINDFLSVLPIRR